MRCDELGATAIAVTTSSRMRPLEHVICWPLVKSGLIGCQLPTPAPPVADFHKRNVPTYTFCGELGSFVMGGTNATRSPHADPVHPGPAANTCCAGPVNVVRRWMDANCVELKRYRLPGVGSPRFIAHVVPSPVWKLVQNWVLPDWGIRTKPLS